ncbi:SIS domain-containing protein, partial [Nocardiopsis sediminis]
MALPFDESRLDTPGAGAGLLRAAASAAARVRSAHSAAREADLRTLADDGRPRSIVVVGSGAAAFAGDVLDAVLGTGCPIPITTAREDRLPGWVAGHDLVVAVASTSGHAADGTARTARVAAEAVRRGCRFLAVGPAGGPLEPLADQARAPRIALPAADDPLDLAWGQATAVLAAAGAAGLAAPSDAAVEAAAVRLEAVAGRCRPDAPVGDNPAKDLAADLAGTLPLVWGATPVTAAAARHFASRCAAIAGYPALYGRLPDVLHGPIAVVGGPFGGSEPRSIFDDPIEDGGTPLRLVLMRDPDEPPE